MFILPPSTYYLELQNWLNTISLEFFLTIVFCPHKKESTEEIMKMYEGSQQSQQETQITRLGKMSKHSEGGGVHIFHQIWRN